MTLPSASIHLVKGGVHLFKGNGFADYILYSLQSNGGGEWEEEGWEEEVGGWGRNKNCAHLVLTTCRTVVSLAG